MLLDWLLKQLGACCVVLLWCHITHYFLVEIDVLDNLVRSLSRRLLRNRLVDDATFGNTSLLETLLLPWILHVVYKSITLELAEREEVVIEQHLLERLFFSVNGFVRHFFCSNTLKQLLEL